MTNAPNRCGWASQDPLMVAYHDEEWGVPARDDCRLFEFVTLEGAQAGLSWMTILRRREHYRRAFAGFDVEAVAAYGPAEVERLLGDAGIIRNRAKIEATIGNARAMLAVAGERGSFSDFLWSFVDGSPLQPARRTLQDVPAETPLARTISRELRARGFRFAGPTIVYSLLQACGLVNDHLTTCFRWPALAPPASG